MFTQTFFKLFPPPKFLDIPYAGLDISDDAVRCIEYTQSSKGLVIHRFGTETLSPGIVVGGEIKNPEALSQAIGKLTRELGIHTVKVSLPEEKMYLFKTSVPSLSPKEIRQNIEFKLEENVPLSPSDAFFFFQLLPKNIGDTATGEHLVSVSVAPRTLVTAYLEVLKSAQVKVIGFELQAKAIARAIIPRGSQDVCLIVHTMNTKTGIYVAYGEVMCFTSTVTWGLSTGGTAEHLKKHIDQVFSYWSEHGGGVAIRKIVFVGKGALRQDVTTCCMADGVSVEVGKVWTNAFSADVYIPPIHYEDSLDYAVSAGLALPITSL